MRGPGGRARARARPGRFPRAITGKARLASRPESSARLFGAVCAVNGRIAAETSNEYGVVEGTRCGGRASIACKSLFADVCAHTCREGVGSDGRARAANFRREGSASGRSSRLCAIYGSLSHPTPAKLGKDRQTELSAVITILKITPLIIADLITAFPFDETCRSQAKKTFWKTLGKLIRQLPCKNVSVHTIAVWKGVELNSNLFNCKQNYSSDR